MKRIVLTLGTALTISCGGASNADDASSSTEGESSGEDTAPSDGANLSPSRKFGG